MHKKILSLLLMVVFVFHVGMISHFVYADESEKTTEFIVTTYDDSHLYIVPDNVDHLIENAKTKGIGKPTNVWNLTNQGRYNFSGRASFSRLYTNYNLIGKTSMTIKVVNYSSSNNLTVRLVRNDAIFDSTISTVQVPKNGTTTWTVRNLNSSKKYYISFNAPSDFSGYIQ